MSKPVFLSVALLSILGACTTLSSVAVGSLVVDDKTYETRVQNFTATGTDFSKPSVRASSGHHVFCTDGNSCRDAVRNAENADVRRLVEGGLRQNNLY